MLHLRRQSRRFVHLMDTQERQWMYQHVAHRKDASDRLLRMVDARLTRHKPLQYMLQSQPFCGLDIRIRPPILIPRCFKCIRIIPVVIYDVPRCRPETAEWTMSLIQRIQQSSASRKLRILDLCTGSGCIALALAHHCSHAHVDAVDINPRAVRLGRLNARRLGIPVSFQTDDLFRSEFHIPANHYDVIVCNPPYISDAEFQTLERDVREWEDRKALVGSLNQNPDGLRYYHRLLELLPWPRKSRCEVREMAVHEFSYTKGAVPRLMMEYGGQHQTDALVHLFQAVGPVTVLIDGCDKHRVLTVM